MKTLMGLLLIILVASGCKDTHKFKIGYCLSGRGELLRVVKEGNHSYLLTNGMGQSGIGSYKAVDNSFDRVDCPEELMMQED